MQADESQLPSGQCRYIMLVPEIKGNRCACVNFTLNKAMPSASCDCGHLACYHVKTTDPVTDSQEIEQLKQRVHELEKDKDVQLRHLKQQVEILQEQLGREQEIVVRVSGLEDVVDKSKEEVSQEIKASYRNLTRAWNSIGEVEHQSKIHQEHFHHVDNRLLEIDAELQRLGQRQLELVDADIALEERLDNLEDAEITTPSRGRPRRKSASDSTPPSDPSFIHARRRRSSESIAGYQGPTSGPTSAPAPMDLPLRSVPGADALWTVHVSLLPTSSQPFPFERDTNAYKRCLSRGLHQMVAVSGSDADSFVTAVTKSFAGVLKGRAWMPLQAESCTAEQLAGLPMLRPLELNLLNEKYDLDFLRKHCAVCDANGKIDSLYISMRFDSLSWHFLRRAPIWMDGLEESWRFDHFLDSNDPFDDDERDNMTRPSAGDILPLPSLKRAASEMSRSSSFGSGATATEGEGSRPKIPRIITLSNIEVRRGVKSS